jgi:putative transposase
MRKGRHVVYLLHAHLVFVTKRRGKVFDASRLKRLEEIFRSVCSDFEVELRKFNGESDHAPAGQLSPEGASVLVGQQSQGRVLPPDETGIPGNLHILGVRKCKGHLRSASYFAGSVGGAPLTSLRQYIEDQNRPSAGAL